MWSFLAFLSSQVSQVSPFLVVGVSLTISGLLGMFWIRSWRVPWKTFLVGLSGIFGYHFLYFSAFQHAPAVEANLINYLWPLLIVLLSPLFLPGYHLRAHHLIGALVGLSGAALIITGGNLSLDLAHLDGYLLMAGAALTWACYSLLSKRLPPFPSTAAGGFCFFSGLLSLMAYATSSGSFLSLGTLDGREWLAIILLGIGPMGAAFFTWDAALKRGDPRVIGSLAYLIPFTSTLILVVLGGQVLTRFTALAMLLIVSGAIIGSLDILIPKKISAPSESSKSV
jgi:drug/metabolite transporter (DMT)-like permease